jgi:hypothetical protein
MDPGRPSDIRICHIWILAPRPLDTSAEVNAAELAKDQECLVLVLRMRELLLDIWNTSSHTEPGEYPDAQQVDPGIDWREHRALAT